MRQFITHEEYGTYRCQDTHFTGGTMQKTCIMPQVRIVHRSMFAFPGAVKNLQFTKNYFTLYHNRRNISSSPVSAVLHAAGSLCGHLCCSVLQSLAGSCHQWPQLWPLSIVQKNISKTQKILSENIDSEKNSHRNNKAGIIQSWFRLKLISCRTWDHEIEFFTRESL